jgi:integrase
MALAVGLLLVTGCRRSELLGLALDAVDLDTGVVEIRRAVVDIGGRPHLRETVKSRSSHRQVSLPAGLIEQLRSRRTHLTERALALGPQYQRNPFLLFPANDGSPLRPEALSDRLRVLMRHAGVHGAQPTHGWRHTAATLLFGSGADAKTVQNRLGHSTPAITLQLYVHPLHERDQAAADYLGDLLDRSADVTTMSQEVRERSGSFRKK